MNSGPPLFNLAQAAFGEKYRIVRIIQAHSDAQRLSEMGLVEGQIVELIRKAPLGDPYELQILDYHLCLRRNQLENYLVCLANKNPGADTQSKSEK